MLPSSSNSTCDDFQVTNIITPDSKTIFAQPIAIRAKTIDDVVHILEQLSMQYSVPDAPVEPLPSTEAEPLDVVSEPLGSPISYVHAAALAGLLDHLFS